ncbi:MAG: GNAT family N-acetyltransferase [Phaeodactylibacter sp.]|nr:GNAT family N-acetyltransferase [Phaeodactylibacter sp.]MCB9266964.1 GNAT family N-acetyltransferase [Lewinellaceae bacterium]MCB9287966.1 GNAT family N-acetyltransferase [Lewinellaceae bacterium]
MGPQFVRAEPRDAPTLSALAWRAKKHWGYPEDWMQLWKGELTISPEDIERHEVIKIMGKARLAGFYALQNNERHHCTEIGHFWIEPACMGKGYGGMAFHHLLNKLRQKGEKRLIIESDPYAAGFYEKMGAQQIGRLESSISGRYLPVYEILLPDE